MIVILICLCAIYGLYICYKWKQLQPYNQSPLDIKTFDGSNSPYHPAVLYFKDSWNGYKYWMAETPFSPQCRPYMDRNECPSIHVSNNGIDWKEVTNNPIDNLNDNEIQELDYFSDPHLIYANNRLECWYRFTHRGGDSNYYDNLQLVRKTSHDGVNWSNREILVNLATAEGNDLGNMVVSPSILYQNGKYRMWYVNSESRITRGLSYSESTDGHHWNVKTDCVLQGKENTPWHIDVNYIDGQYYLVSYDFATLTLWKSTDGIIFSYIKEILSPSVHGSFYGYSLYRACIIKDDNYKIYFSSNDFFKTHIGLIEGKDLYKMKVTARFLHTSLPKLTVLLIRKNYTSLRFIINRILKSINTK